MTIGEQLKKTRLLLGITQEQMCAGSIAEAYYSRVERDINEINITSLIKMLNNRHVSLYDFFLPFDIAPIDEEIQLAFINHDRIKLDKLSKSKRANTGYYKFEFKLINAIWDGKTDSLSEEFKQKVRRQFLQIGKFNVNFLIQIQFVLPFATFEEAKSLMDYVFMSSDKLESKERYLPYLASTFVAYLKRCIAENQLGEARKGIAYIPQVTITASTTVYKALAAYYQAVIAKDDAKVDEIKRILQIVGYADYLNE